MLKVNFFTCFSFPQGTYFRWHNLAIGLQRLGHQVTVHSIGEIHGGPTRFEIRDGVRYVLVPLTPFIHRLLGARLDPVTLLRSIRHADASADVCHLFQPFPHSCIPALFYRQSESCVIFDWDDLWWGGFYGDKGITYRDNLQRYAVRYLEHAMPGNVDGVTTCSAFLAEAAHKHGALATQIIHNGYWPVQSVATKLESRKSLGLDPQAFYFGFMGRTTAEILWCLDVLTCTKSHGQKIRLALCGMPPATLESLPSECLPSIDYLGTLTHSQSQMFAKAIDCGLLPLEDTPFNQSRFPIKFAEYLAGGAHVVASSIGEFARLAEKLPNVTLAGQTREDWRMTLGNANLELLNNDVRSSIAHNMEELLGWQKISKKLEGFYFDRLLQKKAVLPSWR